MRLVEVWWWANVSERQRQQQANAPDLSIPEAVDLYIRRKRTDWKGDTERTYRRGLSHFEDYAAENDIETVSDLTRWNIGSFTDYLLDQDIARVTVLGRQRTTKTWLKYLESQGLVPLGFHLAIDTLKLDADEETSDEQLAPEDTRTLLSFYRGSAEWRGRADMRYSRYSGLWAVARRGSGHWISQTTTPKRET